MSKGQDRIGAVALFLLAASKTASKTMKTLLVRSLLAAVLIGPLVTFVSTVAFVRTTVKYEPGISEDELKSYDNRTVSDLDAFLKSRQVKFTRSQWLRESIGYAYFWKAIAWKSLGPSIGIFLGCIAVGRLERRQGSSTTLSNS